MKQFSRIAVLFLILLLIAGCGNKSTSNNPVPSVPQNNITEENKTPVASEDANKNAEPDKSSQENKTVNSVEPQKTVSQGAKLFVTQNFGRDVIFNKSVALENNATVMDILKANIEVTTKWDDSFINSINGLESYNAGISGKRRDWFYYINGICTDMGANDYELQNGEAVWWDYHVWENMSAANSAVIGCYPEPFVHGYGGKISPPTIMASDGNQSLAAALGKALESKGVNSVNLETLNNEKLADRKVPTIVIGRWDELQPVSELDKFNQAYKKTGVSVHFSDTGLELLNYKGSSLQTVSSHAGVIVAFGSGLGDPAPLWLIAGVDQNGLEQAVSFLVNNPDKISGLYNAAVVEQQVIRLPLN